MKKRIAFVLASIMVINMLLFTSCGKEATNSSKNPSGTVVNTGVTFDGYPDESLDDYIAASPFYTAGHLGLIYGDSEYLEKREVLIKNIISTSDVMVQNLEYFLALSDDLQWEVLSNYKYFSELDPEVGLVHEMIRDKYIIQMVHTAEIVSRIKTLEETDTQDPYIKAWNDYDLVQNRLELAALTFERVMEITEDNQLLKDYIEENERLSEDIGIFGTTDGIFDQFPQDDPYVESQYLNMAELLNILKALQSADTYATIWAIGDAISGVEDDLGKVSQVEENHQLNETEISLLEASLLFQKEMLIAHRETILRSNGLMGEFSSMLDSEVPTLDGVQDLLSELKQYFDNPVYAEEEDNLDKAVQILQETKRGEEENREISRGFFSSIKEKLSSARKSTASFVGRYLEKASTITYKASITVVGSYYGISKEDIEDEKRDAVEIEKQRLLDGTAGSQVIRDGIAWLEDKEQWIGEIAKDALGEDSRTARLIGYGSKFAIQKYTSASKSMMVLIDANATDEEIAAAFSDVVVTTLGELKVLENTIGRLDKDKFEKALGIYDDAMDVFNITEDLVTDENNRYKDSIIGDLEEKIVKMDENGLAEKTVENLDQIEKVAEENISDQLEFLYGEAGSEAFGGYKTSAFDPAVLEVAKDMVESGVSPDIDFAGMDLEDNSAPEVETNIYPELDTEVKDNEVATDNGGSFDEKPVEDKTEGKLTGTYVGRIYTYNTIWGSGDSNDPVQLVVTNNQMTLASIGSSQILGDAFSFSYIIEQTDINYVAGRGTVPDHYFELLDGTSTYDSIIGCRFTNYKEGRGKFEVYHEDQYAGSFAFEVEK